MSILSWNYRGLGQPRTVQQLSYLVRRFCRKIVFISETRQHSSRVSNLQVRLGFKNAFVVDMLFWDESINISILSYGMHHIDTFIWDNDNHTS
jgi:hypothetical protein